MSLEVPAPFLWVPDGYENPPVPPPPLGYLVKIDRRTGKPVGAWVPVDASEFPIQVPPSDQTVWRYLDFYKFKDIALTRLLYFRRADLLPDKLEGKYAKANRKRFTSSWEKFCKLHGIKTTPKKLSGYYRFMPQHVFLNCWHINDRESGLMWKSYTSSTDSVVLRTRVEKLATHWGKRVAACKVVYAGEDQLRAEWFSLAPFMMKRPGFAVENEFRLILQLSPDEGSLSRERALNLRIEPRTLIEEIILHPRASKRFARQVRNLVTSRLGPIPVRRSSLP